MILPTGIRKNLTRCKGREKRVRDIRRGFTLVEILLVVILIGVILSLSVPYLAGSYQNARLQKCARDIAYLMRYAQGFSVIKHRMIRLEFDADRTHYSLSQEALNTGPESTAPPFEPVPGRWGRSFAVPEGIKVSPDNDDVMFSPDGRMTEARILVCEKRDCLTVVTGQVPGQVRIVRGHTAGGEGS